MATYTITLSEKERAHLLTGITWFSDTLLGSVSTVGVTLRALQEKLHAMQPDLTEEVVDDLMPCHRCDGAMTLVAYEMTCLWDDQLEQRTRWAAHCTMCRFVFHDEQHGGLTRQHAAEHWNAAAPLLRVQQPPLFGDEEGKAHQ